MSLTDFSWQVDKWIDLLAARKLVVFVFKAEESLSLISPFLLRLRGFEVVVVLNNEACRRAEAAGGQRKRCKDTALALSAMTPTPRYEYCRSNSIMILILSDIMMAAY